MEFRKTGIEGVWVVEPQVWNDDRGYFFESFSRRDFETAVGRMDFVQDNESRSRYGVVRGLHYQLPPKAQSKLVRVVRGSIMDVAVDIRRGSPTFGRHVAVELSAENKLQLFIPRGFAHGFSVLSAEAVVLYKCDEFYSREHEASIAFDDPALGIDWGIAPQEIIVSSKDRAAVGLEDAVLFEY